MSTNKWAAVGTLVVFIFIVAFFITRGVGLDSKIDVSMQEVSSDSYEDHIKTKQTIYDEDYDEDVRTLTLVKDGVDKAVVKLDTPLINYVFPKAENKVWEVTLNNSNKADTVDNIISDIKLYDRNRGMKEIHRNVVYKWKEVVEYQVPKTREVCEYDSVLNNGSEKCTVKQEGYETKTYDKWHVLDKDDEIPLGVITIGGFAEVKIGDNIEWVITLYGDVVVEQWATWVDGYNTGLGVYYNLDDATGTTAVNTLEDAAYDMTVIDNWSSGILAGAYNASGSIVNTSYTGLGDTNEATINAWINVEEYVTNDFIFATEDSSTGISFYISGGAGTLTSNLYAGTTLTCGTIIGYIGKWIMITLVTTDADQRLYLNGTLCDSDTATPKNMGNQAVRIAGRGATNSGGFTIDEIAIWNRTLSGAEIIDLYNNGTGLTYPTNDAPTTPTWNYPAGNGTTILGSTYSVNWTNSTDANGDSLTYYLDIASDDAFTTIVQSNASITETATPTTYEVTGLADGTYYARVRANDGTVNSSWASTYWTQQSGINVTLNTPENNLNSTVNSIVFNCSAYDPDTVINNLTLYIDAVGVYSSAGVTYNLTIETNQSLTGSAHDWYCNATNTNGESSQTGSNTLTIDPVDLDLNVPSQNANFTSNDVEFNCTANSTAQILNITLILDGVHNYTVVGTANSQSLKINRTLNDGNHDWSCLSFDVNQFNESTTNRSFGIDITLPEINVTSYNTTIVTYSVPVNVSVNWTVTDTNIDSSWVSYNGSNYTGVGSAGSYGLSFGLNGSRQNTYYIYANDTYGNLNRTTLITTNVYHITFNISENLDPITEGQLSVFKLIIKTISIPNTAAIFVWNNTDYGLGSRTKTGTDTYTFTKSFTIPTGLGNSTGNKVSYYWNYTMLGVKNDSLTSNQSVINFLIGQCNATYNIGIINYTLYDEETQSGTSLTNTSIATDITLSSADESYSWDFSINTTENNLSICMSNLTNGSSLRLTSVAQYSSDSHEIEFHYIQDFNVTRSNHTQVVNLFDLATADSTSFIVSFKDATHLPVENAIIDVWRYYIAEGRYKSVEHGKTNDQGETTVHLVVEDVIYNFYIRKDQSLLWVSPDYQVVCQTTPCQLNFLQSGGFLGIPDFATIDNLDYELDTDASARTVTLTYSVVDGSNSKVELTVTKLDAYLNDTVCSETETSSGGTLTCAIPETYANDTFLIELYKDDAFAVSELFNMDISFEGWGSTGTLMTALLYLVLVLMVVGNPIISIGMGVFGLIVASTLMIFGGGSAFGKGSVMLWLICAAGILIYKMANRSRN